MQNIPQIVKYFSHCIPNPHLRDVYCGKNSPNSLVMADFKYGKLFAGDLQVFFTVKNMFYEQNIGNR